MAERGEERRGEADGWLFLLVFCVQMLLTSREIPWADARVTQATAQALIDRGTLGLTIDEGPSFFAERGGQKYAVFPLGNVAVHAVGYLLFKLLRAASVAPEAHLLALCCHVMPAALIAGSGVLFGRMASRWGASPRQAAALALALAFSTICFVYGRSPYSEALSTFAMTWLGERCMTAARRPGAGVLVGAGAAAGVLVSSKLVYVVCLPVFALYLLTALRDRGRPAAAAALAWAAAPLGGFVALAAWHNWLKTGSPLDAGYRDPDGMFSGSLLAGIFGYLVSPGKGLFWYSPPLLLALRGARAALSERRRDALMILGVFASLVLVNGRLRMWHGDWCWGPRHLVSMTPLLLLLAVPWWARAAPAVRRWTLGTTAAVGVGVQLVGASLYWDHYLRVTQLALTPVVTAESLRHSLSYAHFIPHFSPIAGHLWLLSHLWRGDPALGVDAPWRVLLRETPDLSAYWAALRLDWWALDLAQTHLGARLIGLELFLIGLAAVRLRGALGARGEAP